MDPEYILKCIIVGNAGVGKSAIVRQFVDKQFVIDSPTTVGVEFEKKQLEIDNKIIKLHIWDTAGQERFRSVTRSYYTGSHCRFLVFDVTKRSSYIKLGSWLRDINDYCDSRFITIIIGNKIDISEREVTHEEASNFAIANNCKYFECSAKDYQSVNFIFEAAIKSLLFKIKTDEISPEIIKPKNTITVTKPEAPAKRFGCC